MKLFYVFLILFCYIDTSLAQAPKNLAQAKRDIVKYYESGAYDEDVAKIMLSAKKYLKRKVDQNNQSSNKKKLAIVFDIDDTVFSFYEGFKNQDFAAATPNKLKNIYGSDFCVNEDVLDFYNFAKSKDVAVFFVTARAKQREKIAIEQLSSTGFANWNGLYIRSDSNKDKIDSKIEARKDIIKKGYTIIMNIGDQDIDFAGGYSGRIIKIPNPIYESPRGNNLYTQTENK